MPAMLLSENHAHPHPSRPCRDSPQNCLAWCWNLKHRQQQCKVARVSIRKHVIDRVGSTSPLAVWRASENSSLGLQVVVYAPTKSQKVRLYPDRKSAALPKSSAKCSIKLYGARCMYWKSVDIENGSAASCSISPTCKVLELPRVERRTQNHELSKQPLIELVDSRRVASSTNSSTLDVVTVLDDHFAWACRPGCQRWTWSPIPYFLHHLDSVRLAPAILG